MKRLFLTFSLLCFAVVSAAELSSARNIFVTYYSSSHDAAYHHPIAVSAFGDVVEFEDGTVWTVQASDKYKTLDWIAKDTIAILPNTDWFKAYDYCLVNFNTGAMIRANLDQGPIESGYYTYWIDGEIDLTENELVLNDGSVWLVSNSDASKIKRWKQEHTIIVGINEGFFSNKQNILINVDRGEYVAASCIN